MSSDRSGKTIGELSRASGLGVETIRYYERAGLIAPPGRTSGNYRCYDEAAEARLLFVRKARDLGFPLKTVRALLALADQPDRPCCEVDELVKTQLAEVEQKIADLSNLRRELSSLAAQCGGGRISECRIVEALSPTTPQGGRK